MSVDLGIELDEDYDEELDEVEVAAEENNKGEGEAEHEEDAQTASTKEENSQSDNNNNGNNQHGSSNGTSKWSEHQEFEDALGECQTISKSKISVVTALSMKYIARYKDIVHYIEKFIRKGKTTNNTKLPQLYIIDSLCRAELKEHTHVAAKHAKFIKRFGRNIDKTFHALCRGPPSDRAQIKRVFSLWVKEKWFEADKMKQIMHACKAFASTDSGSNEHSRDGDKHGGSKHKHGSSHKRRHKRKEKGRDKEKQSPRKKDEHDDYELHSSHDGGQPSKPNTTAGLLHSLQSLTNGRHASDDDDDDDDEADMQVKLERLKAKHMMNSGSGVKRKLAEASAMAVQPQVKKIKVEERGPPCHSHHHMVSHAPPMHQQPLAPAHPPLQQQQPPHLVQNAMMGHQPPPQYLHHGQHPLPPYGHHPPPPHHPHLGFPPYGPPPHPHPHALLAGPPHAHPAHAMAHHHHLAHPQQAPQQQQRFAPHMPQTQNQATAPQPQTVPQQAQPPPQAQPQQPHQMQAITPAAAGCSSQEIKNGGLGWELSQDQSNLMPDRYRVFSCTIYVGFWNDIHVDIDKLREESTAFGPVLKVMPHPTKPPHKHAFVQFGSRLQAENAKSGLRKRFNDLQFIQKVGWGRPPRLIKDTYKFDSGVGEILRCDAPHVNAANMSSLTAQHQHQQQSQPQQQPQQQQSLQHPQLQQSLHVQQQALHQQLPQVAHVQQPGHQQLSHLQLQPAAQHTVVAPAIGNAPFVNIERQNLILNSSVNPQQQQQQQQHAQQQHFMSHALLQQPHQQQPHQQQQQQHSLF